MFSFRAFDQFQAFRAGTPGEFVPPTTRLWTPLDLPDDVIQGSVWFRFSDEGSLVLVDGKVSRINDTFGNGFYATQTLAANQPTFASPETTFDGHDFLTATTSVGNLARDVGALSVFGTLRKTNSADEGHLIRIRGGCQLYLRASTSAVTSWVRRLTAEAQVPVAFSRNIIGVTSVIGASINFETAEAKVHVDGDTVTSQTTLSTGMSEDVATGVTIGAIDAATAGLQGGIRELFIFPHVLELETRQQLEGWMAWEAGTISRLSAGHPYKNVPPTVLTVYDVCEYPVYTGDGSVLRTGDGLSVCVVSEG